MSNRRSCEGAYLAVTHLLSLFVPVNIGTILTVDISS
jgi:hypothetical protein